MQKPIRRKPVVLIVLDGWGLNDGTEDNAIAQANTPFYDHLWQDYPHATLDASEEHVGLPKGQIGNSEIGHMTIGAGTTIHTDLVRIEKAIQDNTWDANPAFTELFNHVKSNNSTLHVQGLVSPGGVHSHSNHLYAFLEAAKQAGIHNVVIHAFTDGRDTPPQSAASYLRELEQVIEKVGIGFIATTSGRFYAMDRDNNWDRLQKVEDALFECKGKICTAKKPSEAYEELYKDGILDEHAEPLVFLDDNGKSYKIEDNDGIFFFNFRSDRGRMLSKKIIERNKKQNLCFVTMTQYDETFECLVAFPPRGIDTTLASEISKAGLQQAHIAETEKYPHATYFLNGGKQDPHEGEVHILVESRKDVPTHDLAPKMRAKEIADKAIEQIERGSDFLFINFANADMVGHTANQPAIIEAVEEVDQQLSRVAAAVEKKHGVLVITADHGNAEVMIDPITKEKHTAHTLNKVPAIITDAQYPMHSDGTLADIAPTVLYLMNIEKPASMTGKNLIIL
ncbi:MAG TPA: 2,3-bisphosphoglycerate-independent phosphoglycerate mutase [Candidatus Andersenbacteria bacterium]|nr:2,3-bisphosphoglycerate-independent phosphoglycerate mutase [Candidatus Andersenbacteria bacterium]